MIYDYNNMRLLYKSKIGIVYDLSMKKHIVLVTGDSATGKTFLVNELAAIRRNNVGVSDAASNICIVSSEDDIIAGKFLYIIDRGDMVLTETFCERIISCRGAHFLIFARGSYPLGVTPNNYAELAHDEGIIRLHYFFNESWW